MDVLSIVIPAYNEERFIGTLLRQIKAVDLAQLGIEKEIIVVDDCSRDGTPAVVAAEPGVTLHRMATNGGKGRAVRAGIGQATGDYLIIQDADLEYDPNDYIPMLHALLEGRGDAVYGSRHGQGSIEPVVTAYLGAQLEPGGAGLGPVSRHRDGAQALQAQRCLIARSKPPGSRPPITARLLARGAKSWRCRLATRRAAGRGKKIGLRDWFIGCRTFWRYRRG
jgi:glycosyltransferase involved in cell wall biosynthesis